MLCKVKVFMAVNLMAILLLVVEVEGRVLVVSLVYVRLGEAEAGGGGGRRETGPSRSTTMLMSPSSFPRVPHP